MAKSFVFSLQGFRHPRNILFIINVFNDSCQHKMSNSDEDKVKVNLIFLVMTEYLNNKSNVGH